MTISQMSFTKKHSNKKPRLAILSTRGLDRISNLHESLLSNILSRLPTKDAVRTSILSKNWKWKWVLMNNVNVETCSESELSFARFLDEILISNQHLRRFRVTFPCAICLPNKVQKWMNAAVRHNLEFLDVNSNHNELTVPVTLLNSTTLREIRMAQPLLAWTQIKVNVAEKNCAPNLTRLCLQDIVFVTENPDSSRVSFDFPVLETLECRGNTFSYGRWLNVKSVEINAPLLTSFLFEPKWLYYLCGVEYTIKIVAPRLTRFLSFNGLPENLILDWSSIVSAILAADEKPLARLLENFGSRAANVVNALTNLEELTLSRRMAEVLRNGPPLHYHNKLKRLTLFSGCNANQLLMLLHAMPSLKFFSVNLDYWEDFDYEAMEITPSCIATCLEEVVLQEFRCNVPQYNLAEFLLRTAKTLKKFTITTNRVDLFEEMKNVLSAVRGCSPSLEISSRLPDTEDTYTRKKI